MSFLPRSVHSSGETPASRNSTNTPRKSSPSSNSSYSVYSSGTSRRSTANTSNASITRHVVSGTASERERASQEMDSIRVVVRVRPMNATESQREDAQAVFCLEDNQTIQVQSTDEKSSKPMTFHRVFNETSSQDVVFEDSGVKNLVTKTLDGYNTTIFAFGQTGSGKTYTITGPEDVAFDTSDSRRWGIVPTSLSYLFEQIARRVGEGDITYTVRSSYLEIYNEQVKDLLNPTNGSLPVRWTAEKGFYVENLFVVQCEVLDDCLAVLQEGLRNRKTGETALNENSSRSHGLMTVYVDCEMTDPDDNRLIRKKGKICFVDLAGSEKVKESKATGETLTEALNINKSLLTLGNCISALADMKKKKQVSHVPYRDSKLTKLLSDSLGGSGLALMIACITPSLYNLAESLKTLRYASRAKHIQNRPVIQMDPREELIMQLKKDLKASRTENEALRFALTEFTSGKPQSEITKNIEQLLSRSASISAPASRLPSAGGANLPSVVSTNSAIAKLPPVAGPSESPKDPNVELSYKQQMLAKFIEESREIKSQNAELISDKHRLQRENRELMSENDRLITKIEKLVEIFGANVDSEMMKYSANAHGETGKLMEKSLVTPAQTKLLSSTRLLLLSRRSNSNLTADDLDEQEGKRSGAEKSKAADKGASRRVENKEGVINDYNRKPTIDRSIEDLGSDAATTEDKTTPSKKNRELRKDLDRLDEQIISHMRQKQ